MPQAQNFREDFDQILHGHRRGFRDRPQTVENLSRLFHSLSSRDQGELCETLGQLIRTESLETTAVRGMFVNIVDLAIDAVAQFGPTDHLADFVFPRIEADNSKLAEFWAGNTCETLRCCIFQDQTRFTQQGLTRVKDRCAKYRSDREPLPHDLAKALTELESVIDLIGFERFEQTLRRPKTSPSTEELESVFAEVGSGNEIAAAIKEAENYLHGGGEFDPKNAANLLRTSMEATHRIVVAELEKIRNTPYLGKDRDGERRAYMRAAGFISEAEENFFSAIYTLISREASHRLIAPKETVLVLHTTVSNYIFLLVKRLRDLRNRS